MKQYSRAKRKEIELDYVKCHTIDINDDQRVQNARQSQNECVDDPKDLEKRISVKPEVARRNRSQR